MKKVQQPFGSRFATAMSALRYLATGNRLTTKVPIVVPSGFWDAWKRGEDDRFASPQIAHPSAKHAYSYGITTTLIDTLTSSPFKVLNAADVEVEAGPIVALFAQPNSLDSGIDLFDKTLRGLLQNESGVLWLYGFTGEASNTTLPVTVSAHNAALFEPALQSGVFVGWKRRSNSKFYPAVSTAWFRFPDPEDPWKSLTPFRALSRGITDDVEAAIFNSEFFKNGARLGLVIKTEEIIEDEEHARMQEQIDTAHSTIGKRFRNLFLSGAKWETEDHSNSHRDMEFTEQRRFHREEQRAATGVGPLFLGDVTDGNRANVLGQERVLWRNKILPLQKRIVMTVDGAFFKRFSQARTLRGEFDNTNVEALQADMVEEVDVATKLHAIGFTANELNERYEWGFEDKPSRDTVFMQSTLVPAEDLLDGGLSSLEAAAPKPSPVKQIETDDDESTSLTGRAVAMVKTLDRWRRINAPSLPFEKRMRGIVARHMLTLRAEVLSNLTGFDKQAKAVGVGDLGDILFDAKKTGKQFAAESQKVLKDAVKKGGDNVLIEAGVDASFNHLSAEVTDFIKSRTVPLVGVDGTTRDIVRNELMQAIKAGDTVAQMAKRVRTVFNASTRRAQTIARTEINGAFSNGRAEGMKQQGIKRSQWLTAADEDVRETHVKNNGVIRNLGEKFPNGLTHPHQSGAKPGEVINCRCAAAPIAKAKTATVVPFRKEATS